MSVASLALLLAAAGFHAAANALIKQSHDKLAFTWWMLGVTSILGLPFLLFVGDAQPASWAIVLLSGLLEAVYFVALTRAYSHGDLSQVYPIARGSAPLFVVLWAAVFLGERPSPGGMLGILLVVAGLYLVNLPSLSAWKQPLQGFQNLAARYALLTGLLISAYSTVDKVGVQYFDPVIYLYLILLVGWLALMPIWLQPGRRAALIAEVAPEPASEAAGWRRAHRAARVAACALLGTAAYLFVLTALRISPVSYVSPVREMSVVIGAWIGVRFMGEPGGALRIVASLLVALGVLTIAVAG
jgi:drug/metabolite transporter (DMT)-like permease